MELKFTCPECGDHTLVEILVDAVVRSEIEQIDDKGNVKYGKVSNKDSTMSDFQCAHCGAGIEDENGDDILDSVILAKWIKEHCPQ